MWTNLDRSGYILNLRIFLTVEMHSTKFIPGPTFSKILFVLFVVPHTKLYKDMSAILNLQKKRILRQIFEFTEKKRTNMYHVSCPFPHITGNLSFDFSFVDGQTMMTV